MQALANAISPEWAFENAAVLYALPLALTLLRFTVGSLVIGNMWARIAFLIAFVVSSVSVTIATLGLCVKQAKGGQELGSSSVSRGRKAFLTVYAAISLSVLVFCGISAFLSLRAYAELYNYAVAFALLDVFLLVALLPKYTRKTIVLAVMAFGVVGANYAVGFVAYSIEAQNISHMPASSIQVQAAARFADMTVYQDSAVNIGQDRLSYYAFGFGACEGKAMVEQGLLESAGLQTRLIDLPGEDHMFLEVSVDAVWYVSDPGYGADFWFTTPPARGQYRLVNESVGFSLAYIYGTNPPVFITSDFVPTYAVSIQVLKGGIPLTNGTIVLSHRFQGVEWYVPAIPLDSNGTVTLQLGSMQYDTKWQAEPFYNISVNGIATNQTVTGWVAGEVLSPITISLP
jgi:hypothetical protein